MIIWIIIPTYNELENLPNLVRAIDENLKNHDHHILIVDDNSPDGTGDLAEKLKEKYPLEVLHRAGKLGLGSAYRLGFKHALAKGADFIFEMDADFSHDPKDIPRLLVAAENGADLVLGSRKIKDGKIIGWNWWRHFCSDGAMVFARFLLGLKTKDITTGFRCFRSAALKKINYETVKSNGYAFQVEMVWRLEKAGLKIIEVPVTFVDRKFGQSKLNRKDVMEFFMRAIKLFLGK